MQIADLFLLFQRSGEQTPGAASEASEAPGGAECRRLGRKVARATVQLRHILENIHDRPRDPNGVFRLRRQQS